jgi:peptidoglycan/LPS O-acetylase OafA/YrhL
MNETILQDLEREAIDGRKSNYFQIDFLKAVMIFLVIFDHFVAWTIKSEIGVALWERISIPVFLVVMGFNMGLSFKGKEDLSLKELYSWSYFKKKIIRYIIPFLILYVVSTFIGLFMYGFDFIAMYDGQFYPEHGIINLFIGILPFWGPGNWFLPIIFQSILIMPLLYKGFRTNRVLTLLLTFLIEIAMQITVFFLIGEITSWEERHLLLMFMYSILFYLSAVGLGMWFSFGHKLTYKRNIFMWIIFPISLVYIIAYQFFNFRLRLDGVPLLRGDYHFLVFPYSAMLVLLALRFLPKKSDWRISKSISLIGKSTYHILLTQILGYGMITAWWGSHYGMDTPFNPFDIIDLVALWILFIGFGIMWYKIDRQEDLIRRILYYFNFFIVFVSIFLLSFWAQGFWVPIPLMIVSIYAIAALIIHYVIKRPLTTPILSVCTEFLVISFVSMILQVEVSLPSVFWILFILMGAYPVFALLFTLYSKNKKNK